MTEHIIILLAACDNARRELSGAADGYVGEIFKMALTKEGRDEKAWSLLYAIPTLTGCPSDWMSAIAGVAEAMVPIFGIPQGAPKAPTSKQAKLIEEMDKLIAGAKGWRKYGAAIPIDRLDCSVRLYNCLQCKGYSNLGEVANCTEEELLAQKNFGNKALLELKTILAGYHMALRG